MTVRIGRFALRGAESGISLGSDSGLVDLLTERSCWWIRKDRKSLLCNEYSCKSAGPHDAQEKRIRKMTESLETRSCGPAMPSHIIT